MRTGMIILIILAVALVACGENDNGTSQNNGQTAQQAPTATPFPTATPWPTLPPTNVPQENVHQGHIYAVGTRTIHIVQPGDTLGQISNQYNIPMDIIANANRIYDKDSLDVGEILFIPPCE